MIIRISWTVSPNHGGAVDPSAVVRVTLSEPPDPATVTDTAILLKLRADNGQPSPVAKRLAIDGATITITAEDELLEASVYEVEITSELTDRQGLALEGAPFLSDFTTSGVFHSANLAPNTLWVTVPERQDGSGGVEVAPDGELGAVMVCGAAALALPGTLVDITHYNYGEAAPSGRTETITATDADGIRDPNTNCAAILAAADYEGRCLTEVSPGEYEPGSFCVAFDNVAAGDRFLIGVEDAFGNRVEIDAGNMRDERTGAQVVDERGALVTFPADERFHVLVPEGAFSSPTVVRITPITAAPGPGELDLSDPTYAALTSQSGFEIVGAVQLDFEGFPGVQIDFSVPYVPAPGDADTAQYFVAQILDFRGQDELTVVDTAFFDDSGCPDDCLVTSDPSPYPGIFSAGTFGVVRPSDPADCYATGSGYVAIGSTADTAYLPTGGTGVNLSFPILVADRRSFAVPVPCDNVTVTLNTFADDPLDSASAPPASRGQVVDLGVLTDDTTPPEVLTTSFDDEEADVDPREPITVIWAESIDEEALDGAVLRDSEGRLVSGEWVLSADGRTMVFVPAASLRFGEEYELAIDGILDLGGQELDAPISLTFSTLQPHIVRTINVDAQGMALIDPVSVDREPFEPLLAVAEGTALEPDFEGGIKIFDLATGDESAPLVAGVATAGFDFDIGFSDGAGATVVTTGSGGGSYSGPFLMTVEGQGGEGGGATADRFGIWRMYELGTGAQGEIAISPVASRIINHSALSYATFNGLPPGVNDPSPFLFQVPNDRGVPVDLAVLDTGNGPVGYVANIPFIGIQMLVPQGMNVDQQGGVQGTLTGAYRSIDVLRSNVLVALRRDGSNDTIVLLDPSLVSPGENPQPLILAEHPLPAGVAGSRANRIVALEDWPTCIPKQDDGAASAAELPPWLEEPEEEGGATTSKPLEVENPRCETLEPRDLVLVLGGREITVLPVSAGTPAFDFAAIDGGIGKIRTPGDGARDAYADPGTQLLLVADGTAGLTVVDFSKPGGSIDDDEDGIDDRVLTTMPIETAAGVPPVANEVTAYVAPSCDLRALVHGSAPVTEISVGEGIGLRFTEIKNLYTTGSKGEVNYVAGYTSQDNLGRVYTNREFNESAPDEPIWSTDENYIDLEVEVTRSDIEDQNVRVRWEIVDPDDPSDVLVHEDYRSIIDMNDYDEQGNFLAENGNDNSYATPDEGDDAYALIAPTQPSDVLQRPEFFEIVEFPIESEQASFDNEIWAETRIANVDGRLTSGVRLKLSDVGGDNFIVKATLRIGSADPCPNSIETGVLSVWDLASIDHVYMPDAIAVLPDNFEATVEEYEIAFVHLVRSGESTPVANLDAIEPFSETGTSIGTWVESNMPRREDDGWISVGSVKRIDVPPACPTILFPQPAIGDNGGSRNPFHTWALSESFVRAHENETVQILVEPSGIGSSLRVVIEDGEGNTIALAPSVDPTVDRFQFSGELCGEVSVAADYSLVPDQYSLTVPLERGTVDLADGGPNEVTFDYPPPSSIFEPIQFDIFSLPQGLDKLNLRVWKTPGANERVFFKVGQRVLENRVRLSRKPYVPVFPPPGLLPEQIPDLFDRGIDEYFPDVEHVQGTFRVSGSTAVGVTNSSLGPEGYEQSLPHVLVAHEALDSKDLLFEATAVHELGHLQVQHQCGNWGYQREASCAMNDDGMFTVTNGAPDAWIPQDGQRLCAEHVRAIRSARYELPSKYSNLVW